jgi:hypothetical protein
VEEDQAADATRDQFRSWLLEQFKREVAANSAQDLQSGELAGASKRRHCADAHRRSAIRLRVHQKFGFLPNLSTHREGNEFRIVRNGEIGCQIAGTSNRSVLTLW